MFSKKLVGALAVLGATAVVPFAVAQELPTVEPQPLPAAVQFCDGLQATVVGTNGSDVLFADADGSVIVAGAGNDVIIGRGGNDTICAGDGDDVVEPGRGDDRVLGDNDRDVVLETFTNGNDDIEGDGSATTS